MSDLIDDNAGGGEGKHGLARNLVEAALRAREEGDAERSELLLDEARRTDPLAVEDLLTELAPGEVGPGATIAPEASDREVELISRTLQPRADAPSRAGITGSGSGADSQ